MKLLENCPNCHREVPVNALRHGGFLWLRITHCRACVDAAYAQWLDGIYDEMRNAGFTS